MIYHYTSLETFLEIIEKLQKPNKKKYLTIWASSAYALNDTMEMQVGYSFIRSFLQSYEIGKDRNKKLSSLMPAEGEKVFMGDDKEFFLYKENTPFVICFTNSEDSLPMWSMYANDGHGVCMGFDADTLKCIKDVNLLANVVYYKKKCTNSKNEEIKEIADFLYHEVQKYYELANMVRSKDVSLLQKFFLNKLCPVISGFIKGEEFRYEDEIRMMFLHDATKDDVFFREGKNGNIIPYIKIEIPIECLQRVILGPCIATKQNAIEMESIKRKYKQAWEIEISRIPYRKI